MSAEKTHKNAIALHHEMYERRCRERLWFRGQTVKQVVHRINIMPVVLPKKPTKTGPDNGEHLSS